MSINTLFERKEGRGVTVLSIEEGLIRRERGWGGIGTTVHLLPPLALDHLPIPLRQDVAVGRMPKMGLSSRWLVTFSSYDVIAYDKDDVVRGLSEQDRRRTDTVPFMVDAEEIEALIAYFLLPPPVEALTPGTLDALRTGALDPEGFYELARPTPVPNVSCRPEAFAWTIGLVLERFRGRYT